jgi:mannosyl-3-phosphoglycerate phosphatase
MLIIFTDLDGTLLNQDDYSYNAALPTLSKLKKQKIPVIPVTSKTRAEVEVLRKEIGLNDPFIVENGSGIFIPKNDFRFNLDDTIIYEEYHLQQLGCTYEETRQELANISQTLGENLRGFNDFSDQDIVDLTGLSLEEAKLAKTRDFTEPFVIPKNLNPQKISTLIKTNNNGFSVVVGDRFSHLIGVNSGKGKAVNWLMKNYQIKEKKITTIGLGNSPNDLPMLENVDIPIIIPSKKGIHSGLQGKSWKIASSPGCEGWTQSIEEILNDQH